MVVEWDPPSVPNGVITAYNIYVDYENGTNDTFVVKGQSTTYIITDLLPYQVLSVEISANTTIGEGPPCPKVMDQTAQTCKNKTFRRIIMVCRTRRKTGFHTCSRIGQGFLHISYVCMKFCPILCQICVGNVRKSHVLVSRTCLPHLITHIGA